MATYEVLYWHDIPIQVRARDGEKRASKQLPDRFQNAIDNAAMKAGLVGDDAYLNLFKWLGPVEREGAVEEIVNQVITELINKYPTINWHNTAKELTTLRRE
jgi:uncharacterized protein YdbL (DUF1318 family)